MPSTYSPENIFRREAEDGSTQAAQVEDLGEILTVHMRKITKDHGQRLRSAWEQLNPLFGRLQSAAQKGELMNEARDYSRDAAERFILTLDVLRERGNNDIAHEAAGTPPVLIYDYDVALDGKDLSPPVNYVLLKIKPPPGVEVFDWKRPYMIIDPRAGHGAGIGGFKPDSQVGVALHGGHPVYFVVFRPQAGAGADAGRRDARRSQVRRRNPSSPSRGAQADRRRQLPGRLGDAGAGRGQSGHHWAAGHQRGAGRGLVGPQGREPDALQRRPARRHPAGLAAVRPRRRRVRRRPSGVEFREAQSGPQLFRQILRSVRQCREDAPGLPRIRALVGRLPLSERGRDSLDRRADLRRQPPVARRGAHRARPPARPGKASVRRSSCSRRRATTSPRRSRR